MDISEHNLPPFSELEKIIETQKYGSVSASFEIYQGKIVAIQGNQVTHLRFKDDRNTDATSVILTEIKDMHTGKKSGNFTFTIKFGEGEIKDLFIYRNLNRSYPIDKGLTSDIR